MSTNQQADPTTSKGTTAAEEVVARAGEPVQVEAISRWVAKEKLRLRYRGTAEIAELRLVRRGKRAFVGGENAPLGIGWSHLQPAMYEAVMRPILADKAEKGIPTPSAGTARQPRIAHIQLECPHCRKTTDAYIEESEAERADVTCEHCNAIFEFIAGSLYKPIGYVSAIPRSAKMAVPRSPNTQ